MSIRTDMSLYIEACCTCGVTFGMTTNHRQHLLDQGKDATFYCPNGHALCYNTVSTEQELREAKAGRKLAEDEAARLLARTDALLAEIGNKAKTIKRMERRAKAGLCQLCNRHFANVEKHVETKHPEPAPRP